MIVPYLERTQSNDESEKVENNTYLEKKTCTIFVCGPCGGVEKKHVRSLCVCGGVLHN